MPKTTTKAATNPQTNVFDTSLLLSKVEYLKSPMDTSTPFNRTCFKQKYIKYPYSLTCCPVAEINRSISDENKCHCSKENIKFNSHGSIYYSINNHY